MSLASDENKCLLQSLFSFAVTLSGNPLDPRRASFDLPRPTTRNECLDSARLKSAV